MNPRYPFVAERAAHRCEYCRAPEAIFNFPFEVEHITPLSRDGRDDDSNLALACRACNVHKSGYRFSLDAVTQTEVPLFNPRQNQWTDHFELNSETGLITGLSPVGRASINRLQMNRAAQMAARLTWIKLGLIA